METAPHKNSSSNSYIKCNSCSKHAAVAWCVQCCEIICSGCIKAHEQLKFTKNHVILRNEEISTAVIKCTNCSDDITSSSWCFECSTFCCQSCIDAHRRIKITKDHTIKSIHTLLDDSSTSDGHVNFTSRGRDSTSTDIPESSLITTSISAGDSLRAWDSQLMDNSQTDGGSSNSVGIPEISLMDTTSITAEQTLLAQDSQLMNQPTSEVCSTSPTIGDSNLVETPKRSLIDNPSTSVERQSFSSQTVNEWFNLSNVLNETSCGKAILRDYELNGQIMPKDRKKLNKLILRKAFSQKTKLSLAEKETIVQQICLLFHKERSSEYLRRERTKKGYRYVGTFEAAYNYRRKAVPKEPKRKRIEDEDDDGPNYLDLFTEDVQASVANMKDKVLDDERKMMEWNTCFEYRAAKMHHYKDFTEIFEEWPYFTQLNSSNFINHDFQRMFGASGLLSKWCNFMEANIQTLADMINDPTARESLLALNVNQGLNEKNIIACMALHHLPINIPTSNSYGRKRWRPSTKRSKNTVFKRVYSKNSIPKAIKQRSLERGKHEIKDHPIIYGIGEDLEDVELFYVALGDTLFEKNSFIDALDACFKYFKVLKIEFPKESIRFWQFIDATFYKTNTVPIEPALASVIDSFDMELDSE